MAQMIPVYTARRDHRVVHAIVDDEDDERVAGYRWLTRGTVDHPRYVYRYCPRSARGATGPHTISLTPTILAHTGRIHFRNGNCLGCRKANLLTPSQRHHHVEQSATVLRQTTRVGSSPDGADGVALTLTRGWVAWIDPDWEARLTRYRWCVTVRPHTVYAIRRIKHGGHTQVVYLHRVIMGLQEMIDGTVRAPGVVALRTPADRETQTLDL